MLTKGDDPSGLTPKSWKGWAYILISTIIIGCVSLALHKVDAPEKYQWSISIGLLVLFLLDIIDITRKIKKDERETLHEAFAERNVAWFMSATLSIGVLYQTFISIFKGYFAVDPFIIAAIFGGILIKGLTNWYLSDK
ncbi:MAG: hypothetical protein H0U57_06830 [Tatlockia sp.]|nr:hypothetical protein [Tatlockia sp.]